MCLQTFQVLFFAVLNCLIKLCALSQIIISAISWLLCKNYKLYEEDAPDLQLDCVTAVGGMNTVELKKTRRSYLLDIAFTPPQKACLEACRHFCIGSQLLVRQDSLFPSQSFRELGLFPLIFQYTPVRLNCGSVALSGAC
jgi:hypothetical protein